MSLTDNKKKLLLWGILAGLAAVMLAVFGNPKNMAICIACFVRDIAGSVGLHKAAVVQYYRRKLSVSCWARWEFPSQPRSSRWSEGLHRSFASSLA